MRLSSALLLFKLPNGHIFRGKDRLVKKVTKAAIESLKRDFEMEEQNMMYLRHPYLTSEQSHGHVNTVVDKKKLWFDKIYADKAKKFVKHRTLEDELSHLKVTENWEFGAGSKL